MVIEHVRANREYWDTERSPIFAQYADQLWRARPNWGIFGRPESEIEVFRDFKTGDQCIELGCGTAYVSAWMVRKGGVVIGLDNSQVQLATARRVQDEVGPVFPLVHGNAEETCFSDAMFDFAISEYGASLWCNPYKWIPEAARILRSGGRLVFLTNHPFLVLCEGELDSDPPAGTMLRRPYFGMNETRWPDSNGVEFHLPHGEMFRCLTNAGFVVDDLVEVQVPADASNNYNFVTAEWASQWPSEEVWFAHKR